jgi:2-polyprenyl-6-methoxyphenol hydroxylase-like FAD-dependent oxidoreductase
MRVVVAGGGPAGLLAALCLDADGHEVTVVDPDLIPASQELASDELAALPRPGVPQARHPHNFLPRALAVLRELAPDVLAEVLDCGAVEVDLRVHLPEGQPDPLREEHLVALASRRTPLERALRRAVCARPAITVVHDRAQALVLDACGEVGGVITSGAPVLAQLVLDTCGRGSPLPASLRGLGRELPQQREDCGITYLSRHYRLPSAEQPTPLMLGLVARAELPYLTAALFRGDNQTFSVIVGADPADRVLRRALRQPAAFDSALAHLPALAPWVAAGRPVSDVMVMAGLHNVLLDDSSCTDPYLPIGDAVLTTNPRLGWGVSVAFLHVRIVRDALRKHSAAADAADAARTTIGEDAAARWTASCDEDRTRMRWWRGAPWEPSPATRLAFAGRADRRVAVANARRLGVLDPPRAHLEDPAVRAAMETSTAELLAGGAPVGVGRAELLASVGAPGPAGR